MPKYVPHKNSPQRVVFGTQATHDVKYWSKLYRSKKVVLKSVSKDHWGTTNTPFRLVNEHIGEYKWQLKEKLYKLARTRPNSVVIDWGCGEGSAAKTVAELFPDLKVIGFSDIAYNGWKKRTPKNLEYLHTTKEALERYLSVNKIKVGLIFSNLGLTHLTGTEFVNHLIGLRKSLILGGTVLFESNYKLDGNLLSLLKEKGYSFKLTHGRISALKRVK